jgi:predicted metal-dependent hydrolase
MIKPDVLIKSKRKSLSLMVNNKGEFVVHAPKQMKLDEIFAFIAKKQQWVKEKKQQVANVLQTNKKLFSYEQMLFLGKVYDVVRVKGLKESVLENGFFCIPEKVKEEKVSHKIKQFLMQMAEEVVLDRLDYFAELMDLDFNSVKIVSSKAKWGSCDAKLNLAFNFKLIMLPPNLIDYIVIHELAHILQFNHSPQFWAVVASILPTYKKHRQLLKESGFLLNLFQKEKL